MRTRVKICGITRLEDMHAAVAHGCDAIGLVFHAGSPRYVTVDQAALLSAEVSPFVCVVGLFVDTPADDVRAVLRETRLDMLQFHGDESPQYCRQFAKPYLKAVRVRPGLNLLQYAAEFSDAAGLLLDAYREGVAGGTGETFDWGLIPHGLPRPVVLAGGLNAANVADAIRQVRPYAVDVSGGVERQKGIKDADRIAAFMRSVRACSSK